MLLVLKRQKKEWLNQTESNTQYIAIATTDGWPKGAFALPRKNNSAFRNENRAIVSTGMKILSE